MKKERIIAFPQPVIDGQRGGCYRAVCLVLRQYAAGGTVLEKSWDVFKVPDIGVIINGMIIVEMKAVVKMVGINRRYSSQYKDDIK